MTLGPLYVLLGEVSVQVFNWVVCLPGVYSYEFIIYFGDQTLVWCIIGNYVFSYISPFILLMFSLVMQKLFILMKFRLFIHSFMSLALGDMSVRMLLCGMSEIFLPMFSSRSFMESWLIFKCFIHLELILVYGVSWCLSFLFLHVAVQISQHHWLKRLFLFYFMLLPPLSNTNRL